MLHCSPTSTPRHVSRAPRTLQHVERTRLTTRPHRETSNATPASKRSNLPTYTLTCATPYSHDNDYYYCNATRANTNLPATPRTPPTQAPRNPSNTRQTPAHKAGVLKHENARHKRSRNTTPAFTRQQLANPTRSHADTRGSAQPVKHPPTKPEFESTRTHALRPSGRSPKPPTTRRRHTQARRRRSRRRRPRAEQTPKQSSNHQSKHNKRRNETNTCRQSSTTEVLVVVVVVVVFVVSRCQHRKLRTLTEQYAVCLTSSGLLTNQQPPSRARHTAMRRTYWPRNTTPSQHAATPSNLPNLQRNTTQPRQRPILLQRHPREHQSSRNKADTTNTRLRGIRQTPALKAGVLKHENARPASKRTFAKADQHTPPPHTQARRRRGRRRPPRAEKTPTQADKAAISKDNHHNKRSNENNTHVVVRGQQQRSSSLLSVFRPRRRRRRES